MANSTWKKYEWKIGKKFGMVRALQKGTRAKEDIAYEEGIDATPWIIDAKKRKELKVWTWMRELCEYAAEKGKPPILVFQPWGKPQNYAVVEAVWFCREFSSHTELFAFLKFHKNERKSFETAWQEVKKAAQKNKASQFPALAMRLGHAGISIDYICLKLENLISLMKAKNMLEGEDEKEIDADQ